MKSHILIITLLFSLTSIAGEFQRFNRLFYVSDSSSSYTEVGEIYLCFRLDATRNLVSHCYSFSRLEKNNIFVDLESGLAMLENDGNNQVIGKADSTNKTFYSNDEADIRLKTVHISNSEGYYLGASSSTGIDLNDNFGCGGVFDCDFDIFSKISKYYLHIKKESRWRDQTIEKIRVY